MANVYLVCEGLTKEIDQRVLDALVVQKHNLFVRVRPAEGDRGLGAVRRFLDRRPHDVALSVQDRNYRPRQEADQTWSNPQGSEFIWRRHEIENYLLAPQVVFELFEEYRRTVRAAWVGSLPATEPDVLGMLQRLAAPLLPTHAACVLKEELVRHLNAVGGLGFGPRRPPTPPGAHAPGQADWETALQQEAVRLCHACEDARNLPALQPSAISARYGALLVQFQDPAFLTSGEFLLDLDGHSLLGALSRELSSLGPKINQDSLADQLLQAAERIYQPGHLYQPDDFAELAQILAPYC